MRTHTTAADYPRDFAFDDEVQERPAPDRAAFANIRPLAEVKARQAALAAEFDHLAASAAARPRVLTDAERDALAQDSLGKRIVTRLGQLARREK